MHDNKKQSFTEIFKEISFKLLFFGSITKSYIKNPIKIYVGTFFQK